MGEEVRRGRELLISSSPHLLIPSPITSPVLALDRRAQNGTLSSGNLRTEGTEK
jgi:hypothetical protein